MITIEKAFDIVNNMSYTCKNGDIVSGELLSLQEVRELINTIDSPIDAYVTANKAIYHYIEKYGY